MRREQPALGLVHRARRVAAERGAEAPLELGDVRRSRLPARGGAEQHAVPVGLEQRLAVVVPAGVERAGRAESLPRSDEALDVGARGRVIGEHAVPAVHARGDPRFEACVEERLEQRIEAVARPVVPRDGDEVVRQ